MKISKDSLVLYKEAPWVVKETIPMEGKIEITGPRGKTMKVREKDIVLLSSGKTENLNKLFDSAYLDEKEKTLDLENKIKEIWELAGGEEISFGDFSAMVFDSNAPDLQWLLYKKLKASPWFTLELTEDSGLNLPVLKPNSQILANELIEKKDKKQKETRLREDAVKRLKNREDFQDEDIPFLQEVEAFALGKSSKSAILREAGIPETQEKAHKILLQNGFWSILKNPWPTRRGITLASANLPGEPVAEVPRLDLTNQEKYRAYAIDNEDSSDPDDAIGFDGDFLWIHIADPSDTVLPDSPPDIEARKRGSTNYLPEGVFRMLGSEITLNYSLGLEKISKALSFRLKLDEKGDISSVRILKTLVNVERLTYKKASLLKDSNELNALFRISQRNRERRLRKGAVEINLPEVSIILKEGRVSIEQCEQNEAQAMVKEMMLLAGEGAAKFAFENSIPFQFVSQEEPEIPKNIPQGLAGEYRLRRSMRPRQVSVNPSAHHGLGLGMYAQVTSPLRRYGDLVSHQQLSLFLENRKTMDKETLFDKIAQGDIAASECIKAERESCIHWKLVYLLQNPQWQGEAVIVETGIPKAKILIPELAMESQINIPGNLQLNDRIKVKAENIELWNLKVDFVPV
ncbi:MAG: RNB domain-containing ribonuclease [Spirochaetes bacterium]|uniref:RNB domain-containing ribonuclease n=1 Tax=Candidatus Gallitreponema excrementavium TaxID=2840840 RepID=A0A9D9HMN8_9SPIR|nr:RNB domain-containing ribonuclease [Candidatus Gallitreponema excrementavium]